LVGADASHAWVEVYLPGAGADAQHPASGLGDWAGFDPTNGRQPGPDYVVLAVGRDFADVSPMRGVLHGGARHVLDVGVTVQPFDELPAARREGLAAALAQDVAATSAVAASSIAPAAAGAEDRDGGRPAPMPDNR
ncbi:MAG: hypothetical protein ACLGJD_15740, partial [Gammaproteobacteria bacterium]